MGEVQLLQFPESSEQKSIVATYQEMFDPDNREVSLRSFLSDMKDIGYSDSEIYEVAKVEFPKWRDANAYVPIARLLTSNSGFPRTQSIEIEYVPQSRRGSLLYCTKVWARFQDLKKAAILSPQSFTPASFLTLTSDSHNGMKWNLQNIEKAWNKLMTLMRKRYGRRIHFMKVVELTKKGHAHIHAILFCVPYIEKSWLSKTWSRLHNAPIVDIVAVRNLPDTIDYLIKHQQKVLDDTDQQAYFWMHRKRCWTVSKGLFDLVYTIVDLIEGYLIQTETEVICSIRLSAVVLEQAKDPPESETIYLTTEEMTILSQITDKELLELEVSRVIARAWDIPLEWVNRKYEVVSHE